MDRIRDSATRVGMGVPAIQAGLPAHNPEPSTSRGHRRHNKRSDEAKAVATKAWAKARTTNLSRYQKAMAGRSGFNG